jgi:hypothetical protein
MSVLPIASYFVIGIMVTLVVFWLKAVNVGTMRQPELRLYKGSFDSINIEPSMGFAALCAVCVLLWPLIFPVAAFLGLGKLTYSLYMGIWNYIHRNEKTQEFLEEQARDTNRSR